MVTTIKTLAIVILGISIAEFIRAIVAIIQSIKDEDEERRKIQKKRAAMMFMFVLGNSALVLGVFTFV